MICTHPFRVHSVSPGQYCQPDDRRDRRVSYHVGQQKDGAWDETCRFKIKLVAGGLSQKPSLPMCMFMCTDGCRDRNSPINLRVRNPAISRESLTLKGVLSSLFGNALLCSGWLREPVDPYASRPLTRGQPYVLFFWRKSEMKSGGGRMSMASLSGNS